MKIDWNKRYKEQEKDERLFREIKTGDYKAVLLALFQEVRGVAICEHGNMTDYQPCPQCDAEFDEWMRAPEVEEE